MDTQAVLTLLQQAAETYINPRFEALASHEVIEKNPGDLVTVADREAEVFITAELQKAYPDALIVGEEAVAADPSILDRIESADHWFTVDPVDGTKNFVHGSPNHGVMVAEMRGGDIVRSWMWQPQLGHAYVAEKGNGAFLDGVRIEPHVVEYLKTPPSRALIRQLVARAGLSVRDVLREKGTPYAELGLGDHRAQHRVRALPGEDQQGEGGAPVPAGKA